MSLIDGDYLNEERFALAFVKGKFKIKKWGRIRLKAELKEEKIKISYRICFIKFQKKITYLLLRNLPIEKRIQLKRIQFY